MKIAYSGISGSIGEYINKFRTAESVNVQRSEFDWGNTQSFSSISKYDRVFLSFPVNKIDILPLVPSLVKVLRKDQTIIKFGSLGPQRIINDIVDAEIRKYCRLISLELAPTMSSLLVEQINGSMLYDYRYGLPAPYVSTQAAAQIAVKATEQGVDSDVLRITGPENLTISDVKNILSKYQNFEITKLDGKTFVDSYVCSDSIKTQLCRAYDQYKSQHPVVSGDLERNGIHNPTLSNWLESNFKNIIKL